jgi:hypothetical protein
VFVERTVPGDGQWMIRTDERADSGLDALAAALRLPSEVLPSGTGCLDIGHISPVITVTDTKGRQFNPDIPGQACGSVLPAAAAAIRAVPWKTVGTTAVRQSQSQIATESGCPDQYKPVIAMQAAESSGPPRAEPVPATAPHLRICRYDLDPDPSAAIPIGVNGSAGPARSGRLAAASTVDGPVAQAFLTAVAAAPPARACTQPEAPFATVDPGDGTGPHVTVELGGCYRALVDGENYLRQLDAATVAKLGS